MSNDQQLPSPEVDIIKTSHFQTFATGSGGPHLDVLLHNQKTIMKQNQDIRRLAEHLLQGQRKSKGLGSGGKKAPLVEVELDEDLQQSIFEASKRYSEKGGDMKLVRSKAFAKAVEKWLAALDEDEDLGDDGKLTLRAMEDDMQTSLHIQCAEKIRGGKKKKTAKQATTKRGRDREVSEGSDDMNEDNEEEEEDEESDEDVTQHRRKRTKRH
ncbi:hypothetical protein IFR05_014101 [Cadophora sp. M221]|nr:hypothetical protein IFR05_014101 [Cadophora sp. M221]